MLSYIEHHKFRLSFIAAYSFLTVFALVFYFERLYSDSGYYFFISTNFQRFHIEHGRFVLFFAELLPVMGSYLGCSLKSLAILYSLNHVLFPLILALLCIKLFKHKKAAIVITLLQFIGIRESIYTPQFELYYGLSILVFSFAYIQWYSAIHKTFSVLNGICLVLLNFLIFSAHPMGIYCYFLVFSYLLIINRKYLTPFYYAIASIVIYYIWKINFASSYETEKFNQFFNSLKLVFEPSFLNVQNIKNGVFLIAKTYPDVLLIFTFGCYFFIKKNQLKQLAIHLISFVFLLTTIWAVHHTDSITRYTEQVYFPWVFSCIIWLFFLNTNKLFSVSLLICIVFRISIIGIYSQRFSLRKKQIGEFVNHLQKEKNSKFYINRLQMNKIEDIANWSYSFETLIYSAIYCPKHITICLDEDINFENNSSKLNSNTFIFRKWDLWHQQKLNSKYYHLDTGKYVLMNKQSQINTP